MVDVFKMLQKNRHFENKKADIQQKPTFCFHFFGGACNKMKTTGLNGQINQTIS
jgi:hypothetical protein